MGKKMQTDEEKAIHSLAAHIRKMTDSQLLSYMSTVKRTAYEDGFKEGTKKPAMEDTGKTVSAFIGELAEGACKGVKGGTVHRLQEFAKEHGFLT